MLAVTKFLIALGRNTLFDVEVADLPSALEADTTVCQKPDDYPIFLETSVATLLGTNFKLEPFLVKRLTILGMYCIRASFIRGEGDILRRRLRG